MIRLFVILCLLSASIVFSQEDGIILTERGENSIPMGDVYFNLPSRLIVGREYVFNVLASHDYDVQLSYTNSTVVFDESSCNSTGPLHYTITPLAAGKLRLCVGVKKGEERSSSLLARNYNVIDAPMPVIYLEHTASGSVLSNVDGSFNFRCSYPPVFGVHQNYPIKKWAAKLGSLNYSGSGNTLSKELIEVIRNSADRELLYLNVELEENSAGHTSVEAVYIIGQDK